MARLIKSNPSAGALLITALAVGGGVYMLSRTRKKKGASANWYIPSYDELNAMEKDQVTPEQAADLAKMQIDLLSKALQQPPISAKDGDGTRLEEVQDRGFSLIKRNGQLPAGAATLAELDKELSEGIKQAASQSPQVDFVLAMPAVFQKGVPVDVDKNAGLMVLLLESIDLSSTPPKVTAKVMATYATPNIKGLPAVGSKLTTTTDRLGTAILVATRRPAENQEDVIDDTTVIIVPTDIPSNIVFGPSQMDQLIAQAGLLVGQGAENIVPRAKFPDREYDYRIKGSPEFDRLMGDGENAVKFIDTANMLNGAIFDSINSPEGLGRGATAKVNFVLAVARVRGAVNDTWGIFKINRVYLSGSEVGGFDGTPVGPPPLRPGAEMVAIPRRSIIGLISYSAATS